MAQNAEKQPLRILVVDDDEIFLCTLEALLLLKGYRVETARNGVSAIKKLKQKTFDLVLTDLNMPGMNGLELLEKISSEKLSVTPVLMSSLFSNEIKTYASKQGAFANLDKPFSPSRLFSVIEDSLGYATESMSQA